MSEIEEDADEEKSKSENDDSGSSFSSQDSGSEDQEEQRSVKNPTYESEDNQQDMIQSYIKTTPLEQKDEKPFLSVLEQ